VEVFFVDWEKTEIQRPEELDARLRNRNKLMEDVRLNKSKTSVWRTLLIANEFNELQTFRIVSVEWTIFFTGLFLIGLQWQDLASEQPNMNLDNEVPHQYILRYFISTFVYLVIGIVQISNGRQF
jgi:meckelin